MHKAVKVLQIGSTRQNPHSRKVHESNIVELYRQWLSRGDRRLALAMAGALQGLLDKMDYRMVDFQNPDLEQCFLSYDSLNRDELTEKVQSMASACGLKSTVNSDDFAETER